jgi:chitodextrinase
MITNPLIEKYNELYNPKSPEPPKPVEKPKGFITYDPHDLKASFKQVAEQVMNCDAIVTNMSMEIDTMSKYSAGTKITFEIYVHKY